MMNGLNKSFKKDTLEFLRNHAIHEPLYFENDSPQLGIVEFDLTPYGQGSSVEINVFTRRGKEATYLSNRIVAYWLPWQPSGTSILTLGNNADYFFTSQLAGCQICIVPSLGVTNDQPRVLHIAGNVCSPEDSNGHKWRNNQVQKTLSPDEISRSRALSTSGSGPLGYEREGVNVVGFKHRSQWQFWGQQCDFEDLIINRIWQIT